MIALVIFLYTLGAYRSLQARRLVEELKGELGGAYNDSLKTASWVVICFWWLSALIDLLTESKS